MRISALRISNFKRIRELAIDTDRALIILGGKNGHGKTSALDAIQAALTGGKAIPEQPIRNGEDRSEIEVKIDGATVKRTITRKEDGTFGGALTITTAEGMRPQKAQAWLDQRIGDLSCDPIAFLDLKPADQAERLRKIAGVDTRDLDARRVTIYAERTEIGRDGEREAGALAKMPSYPDAPAEKVVPTVIEPEQVSAVDVLAEIEAAAATERAAEKACKDAEFAESLIATRNGDIRSAEEKIAAIRAQLAAAEQGLVLAQAGREVALARSQEADMAEAVATAAIIPVAPLRAKLAGLGAANTRARQLADEANTAARAEADAINAKVAANAARLAQEEKVKAERAKYAGKTEAIAAIDRQRAELLAAAKFPVEGLGFGADGGVTFQGVPLSQASGAEGIRVSMGIALAANPEIRVVLIRDASLLDDDSMELIVKIAEEADAQVWLERVGDRDPGAVVIEDGVGR